jgi:hypothetical protein
MIRIVYPSLSKVIIANVVGAKEFGWKSVCHLLFPEDTIPPPVEGIRQIHGLDELRVIYPHVFQKTDQYGYYSPG